MAVHRIRLAAGALAVLGGSVVAGSVLGGAEAAGTADSDGEVPGSRADHEHPDVTGDELTRVTDAVVASDATITVESVRKDEDGSYDVLGTRAEEPVALDVSADLATITEREGLPGRGGPGDFGTEVTGDELSEVTAAVTAYDDTITVESVREDDEGGYHVLGTRADDRILLEVGADLATITEHEGLPGRGGPGGHGGPGDLGTEVTGEKLTEVTAAVTAYDDTITVESVREDDDGGYHVLGTQADDRILLEVSADLATITEHEGRSGGGERPSPSASPSGTVYS